ncbi:cyclic nucleotide-binding/CBS domain-containing protein [Candidatus Nitrososphaera sp. FF02]|uniref:CBS domain-containing protein n=1 Tax=Candidatus Nitrososphaera sp. FF02 TaxID=3398226 RepID=UPI0039E8BA62
MSIESMPVSEIMTRDVKTADESTSIRLVARKMDKNGIGSIVILDKEGVPSGIITERDMVKLVSRTGVSFGLPVKRVMKKPVIVADIMMSARDALQTMQVKDIRRLPVMEKGKLVGIVTDKDIFKAILKNQSLLTGIISDSVLVEYKPVYDRLAEFMLSEMYLPGGR